MHDINLLENQPIAWTPTPEVIERSQLTRFMRQVGVSTWDELYQYSIRDVEKFTEQVIKFFDIRFDPPYDKLLDTSGGIEFPDWFLRSADTPVRTDAFSASEKTSDADFSGDPGTTSGPALSFAGGTGDADKSVRSPLHAGLNITTMCLDRWQTNEMKDQPAVIWEGEDKTIRNLTYSELKREVEKCAAGLQLSGLSNGDAVGIHLPMLPETVIALLAINRIGAIAVPVFSGYGIDAISSRLNAVGAKCLITCVGFDRRGKFFDALSVAKQAIKHVPSMERIIVVSDDEEYWPDIKVKGISWRWMLASGEKAGWQRNFPAPTSAEDPLIILYTSGTTGKPKGIAHTHASFPIKAAQDMAFGVDVGKGTRICWYTDIGWMMGPWLIYGALINGATICIYDGAPDYPTADRMWEFCARHKVEVLGISPTLVRSLAGSADTLVRMDAASSSKETFGNEKRGWYRHKLPHFDGNVTQFITFRLADSLPQGILEQLRNQFEHDKLTNFSEELRTRIEEYLDAGAGECLLRDPAVARLVEETILNEHGTSCDVKAWVIMPNHAHVVLRLNEGYNLANVMKRIKGISARKINQYLGRNGKVWQADYFDRYIRDSEDFLRKCEYVEQNPVKAGLVKDAASWKFSSAWSADTPVRTDAASASEKTFATSPSVSPGSTAASTSSFAGGTGDADKSVRTPYQRHDLSSLRIFASTGEPWNPAPWWWLFEKVGNSKLPIINYSGGTEISGGILMGNPLLPIKPCSFPAPCPGMDVDIFDENGKSVAPNEVGELVIKQPWIGMARGFWQEKERYLETYWNRFKNIWVHGDWAMRDSDGHWFILGRSDDTLKVAGKRVGPAEVESLLVAHPLVAEAAVIGVPDEVKGTAMVAFCVLRSTDTLVRTGDASSSEKTFAMSPSVSPGSTAASTPSFAGGTGDADKSVRAPLEAELRSLVARDMGKPLAPSRIHFVSALPKTRNAKVMRRVIRAAYLGEDAGDLSSLENPQAVEEIGKCVK